jgi:hypothetical protein
MRCDQATLEEAEPESAFFGLSHLNRSDLALLPPLLL